ncbi:MAG: hypothetical protein IJD58_09950 [Lachnospiraceae bacterium]|nr:hypothetical protein [Lachnospiraceae bacterium]
MNGKYENTKIEKRAINEIECLILDNDFLDSSINSMDKELSWDGYIYTYNDKTFSNKSLDDKIPIQVKGHMDENLKEINKKMIQYGVNLDVLKNYYNDRGVLLFRVILSPKRTEIFYNILFPSKIKTLLREAKRKGNKKQINVSLTKMVKTPREMYRICKQFTIESLKQGSGRGQIVPRSVNFENIKDIRKMELTAVDTNNVLELMKRISVGDVCFYANTDNTDIMYPFEIEKDTKIVLKKNIVNNISVNGKVFYEKYTVTFEEDESIIISVSENLSFDFERGRFNFKKIGTLSELYNDVCFLLNMKENTAIMIHKMELTYSNMKISSIEDDINLIQDLYNICYMANIEIMTPFAEMTDEDILNINKALQIYRGNYTIEKDKLYEFAMKIKGRVYPMFVNKEKGEKICFANRLYESKYRGYIKNDDKYYNLPMFTDLRGDVLGYLYKYDYNEFYHQVNNTDYNTYTLDNINNSVLGLIEAYDINGDIRLLDLGNYVIEKLKEINDSLVYVKINHWQIKKRLKMLSEEDIENIKYMRDTIDDNEQLCGINILLDDKVAAYQCLKKIPEDVRKVFITYPICKFLDDDIKCVV